jgi:hypothetical protein
VNKDFLVGLWINMHILLQKNYSTQTGGNAQSVPGILKTLECRLVHIDGY